MSRTGLLAATAAFGFVAASAVATSVQARTIELVGITYGSPANAYFDGMVDGITRQARSSNPNVRVSGGSANHDSARQNTQIDGFIASGAGVIILDAVDPGAVLPAIGRAHKAGIAVISVHDVNDAADASVGFDSVAAGRLSCQALARDLGGKGNVVIVNGPQKVSMVLDRVKGCKEALADAPGVTLLAADQNGKGSSAGAQGAMQAYLTRYPAIAGVFAINDQEAIGSGMAIKQANRSGIVITSVDGAPDIIAALEAPDAAIKATAAQDPHAIGKLAMQDGEMIAAGQAPTRKVVLTTPKLIDKDNLGSYAGWTGH